MVIACFPITKSEFSMTLPKMHLVAMNRSTTYRKRPAKAFDRMFENIRDRVREQRNCLPDSFTSMDDEVFIDCPMLTHWLLCPLIKENLFRICALEIRSGRNTNSR